MKTLKKVYLELERVEFIPEVCNMQAGKFYYSEKYSASNHLCPCGCGMQTPLPIKEGEWSLTIDKGEINVSPSILHRAGCKSHYVIVKGYANII